MSIGQVTFIYLLVNHRGGMRAQERKGLFEIKTNPFSSTALSTSSLLLTPLIKMVLWRGRTGRTPVEMARTILNEALRMVSCLATLDTRLDILQ